MSSSCLQWISDEQGDALELCVDVSGLVCTGEVAVVLHSSASVVANELPLLGVEGMGVLGEPGSWPLSICSRCCLYSSTLCP